MKKFLCIIVSIFVFIVGLPISTTIAISEDINNSYMINTSYYLINDNCTELNIPEYIDDSMVRKAYISDCPYLNSITIPKWVEVIEIIDCPLLKRIDVSNDNNNYCSINGVLYDKSIEYLILYPPCKEEKNVILPDGLKTIGELSCKNTSFESVQLPDSLTTIENCAFSQNKNLKKINIPRNVSGKLESIFIGCDNLKEVTFQNDMLQPNIFSSFDNSSVEYAHIFDNNDAEQIYIYVPENKVDEYTMLSWVWKSNNYIILPMNTMSGDINNDNIVSVADAVMLQNWLLGSGNLTNWRNADICKDGKIDIFDMVEIRKLIINN